MTEVAHEPRIYSGLDVSRPDILTEDERTAFAAHYDGMKGEQLVGHEFLLEFRPDVLKRYFAGVSEVVRDTASLAARSMGFVHYYGITGWTDGIRQHTYLQRTLGVQRSEFLDVIAIASMHAGPRGMQWLAEALTDELRDWEEPEPHPHFPEAWGFDPDAFKTGLDFTAPELSDSEKQSVFEWYERVLGEVPRSIQTLARDRPRLLKAYRNRFENAIVGGLPKQMMPFCQLQLNLYRGFGEGIRAAAQLCRGFGMTRMEMLDAASSCYFYGGIDTLAQLDQYAGDVVASMP